MTVMLPNHVKWGLELFLVGLHRKSDVFKPTEKTSIKLSFSNKDNLFSAYQELADIAEDTPHDIPNALLINSSLLQDDEACMRFLRSIKTNSDLKEVPIIAISTSEEDHPGCKKLIKMGIDDHYVCPVDGHDLEKRIDFLNEFKGKYAEYLLEDELPEYKIPLNKRAFDIIIGSFIILCISPILAIIAAAIFIESKGGSVIYKSERIGTGYEKFFFLKFRSMYPDADKRLADLQHLNRYKEDDKDASGPMFSKLKNDPRVTKVGRFIRKTSLDELPQLFNVISGEMSIVGNRPLPLYEAEQLTNDQWAQRFMAPAGMTGLWQVSSEGKDTMSVEQRIGLDIDYANNFSLSRDLQILAKTPFAMIQRSE